MKDQYFGDVNDYRKYGLLRAFAKSGLSTGVCWMLTPDDLGRDGEFRQYLTKPSRWRSHDPGLYDSLLRLRQVDVSRSVAHAGSWGLIPGATYFDRVLVDNQSERLDYLRSASAALRSCDLIFFDPDNGIEIKSVRTGRRRSSKYVYRSELIDTYREGHSLLVYQHFPRVDRTDFVSAHLETLKVEMGTPRVAAFTTPHVVFFLVEQSRHRLAIDRGISILQSNWQGQIETARGNPEGCVVSGAARSDLLIQEPSTHTQVEDRQITNSQGDVSTSGQDLLACSSQW